MLYLVLRFVKHTHSLVSFLVCVFIAFANTNSWAVIDDTYNCAGPNQYRNWVTGTCMTCPSKIGAAMGFEAVFCGYGAILCNTTYGYALTENGCEKNSFTDNNKCEATYATAAGGHVRCCRNDVQNFNCNSDCIKNSYTDYGTCVFEGSGKGKLKCDSGYYRGAYQGCWDITQHPDYIAGIADVHTNGEFYCKDFGYYRIVVAPEGYYCDKYPGQCSTYHNYDNLLNKYHGWHCTPCANDMDTSDGMGGYQCSVKYKQPSDRTWAPTGSTMMGNVRWQDCAIGYDIPYDWFADENMNDTSGCHRKSGDNKFHFTYMYNPDSDVLELAHKYGIETFGAQYRYNQYEYYPDEHTIPYNYGQILLSQQKSCQGFMGDIQGLYKLYIANDPNALSDAFAESNMNPKPGHSSSASTFATNANPDRIGQLFEQWNNEEISEFNLCPKCTGNTYSPGSTSGGIDSCMAVPSHGQVNSDRSNFVCSSGYFKGSLMKGTNATCTQCPYWGGNNQSNPLVYGTGTGLQQGASEVPEDRDQDISDCYTIAGASHTDDTGTFISDACHTASSLFGAQYGITVNENSLCKISLRAAAQALCSDVYSGDQSCWDAMQGIASTTNNRTTYSMIDNDLADLTFFQRLYTNLVGNQDCNVEAVWQQ